MNRWKSLSLPSPPLPNPPLKVLSAALVVSLLSLASGTSSLSAQNPSSEENGATASPTKTSSVTTVDLGFAYEQFEQTFTLHAPPKYEIAETNEKFDAATRSFFLGENGEAVRQLKELAAELDPEKHPRRAYLDSFQARFDPPTITAEGKSTLTLTPMYETDVPPSGKMIALLENTQGQQMQLEMPRAKIKREGEIRIIPLARSNLGGGLTSGLDLTRDDDDPIEEPIEETEVEVATPENDPEVDPGEPELRPDGSFEIVLPPLAVGTWSVSVLWFEDQRVSPTVPLGLHLAITPEAIGSVRGQNTSRLFNFSAKPNQFDAWFAVRQRNELLKEKPSFDDRAQVVLDPNALMIQLDQEIRALEEGRDPFLNARGDLWLSVELPGDTLPFRLYAPETLPIEEPVPLVIALHGAGTDENAFLDGYGAGYLKELAAERKFLLASPRTEVIRDNPHALNALLSMLIADYSIDPKRIYLLGHSMGGFASVGLAGAHPDRIAAVVCLAGGSDWDQHERLPPMLIIGAENDTIVAPSALIPAVEAGEARGHDLKYEELPEQGHTLMVGASLSHAVDWLLERKRP